MTSARQHLSRPGSVGVADRGVRRCVASLRPRGARSRSRVCGLPYGVHNYKLRPPQSQGFRREEIKHAHATMFRLYNRKTQQRNTYARAAQRGEGAAAIPLSGALSRSTRSRTANCSAWCGGHYRSQESLKRKPETLTKKPQRQPVHCATSRGVRTNESTGREDKQSMHARSALTAATRLPCGAGGRWETRAVCCVARVHT